MIFISSCLWSEKFWPLTYFHWKRNPSHK